MYCTNLFNPPHRMFSPYKGACYQILLQLQEDDEVWKWIKLASSVDGLHSRLKILQGGCGV